MTKAFVARGVTSVGTTGKEGVISIRSTIAEGTAGAVGRHIEVDIPLGSSEWVAKSLLGYSLTVNARRRLDLDYYEIEVYGKAVRKAIDEYAVKALEDADEALETYRERRARAQAREAK